MSVRKRTWSAADGEIRQAWIADYSDGAGVRRLRTFKTKKAADAFLVTAKTEVSRGTHTPESQSVTLKEAAALWLKRGETAKLERSTLDRYAAHVRMYITPRMGARKLSQLSTPLIEAFKDDLLSRLSWAMTRKVIGALKMILNDAQRRGLVAQNVAASVRIDTRKRDKRRLAVGVDLPTKAEVRAIIEAAADRFRPLLLTAINTGMRSSELRGLTWDDVDFAQGAIRVRQRMDQWNRTGMPKSAAGQRTIRVGPELVRELRQWKLRCPISKQQLVFPNGEGKPQNLANILQREFAPTQIRAGVTKPKHNDVAKYGGLHCLRHYFASAAIEAGYPPKEVQTMLGHSSIQMTFDVYGHLFPSQDDSARIAALETALRG